MKFLLGGQKYLNLRFEYGVILNGSQTETPEKEVYDEFEYGVILNGSQTFYWFLSLTWGFEYGVILNGSQTNIDLSSPR